MFFVFEGNIDNNIFNENLTISNIIKNENGKELTFKLNFLLKEKVLSKNITFTGFNTNFKLSFKENIPNIQTTNFTDILPNYIQTSINDEGSLYYYKLLQKDIQNHLSEIIDVKGNININDLFSLDLIAIDFISEIDDENGEIKIILTIVKSSNDSTDEISTQITLTNFMTASQYLEETINFINTDLHLYNLGFTQNELQDENVVTNKLRNLLDINQNVNLKLNEFNQDIADKKYSFSITLSFQNIPNINKSSNNIEMSYLFINNLFQEIVNDTIIVPVNNDEYNYKNITAKDFLRLYDENNFVTKNYFEINYLELQKKYGSFEEFYNYTFAIRVQKNSFDFKDPQKLTLEVMIDEYGTNNEEIKSFEFTDFKEDDSLVGELDKAEIINLSTPTNAIAYKGSLEKFLIKDIKLTTRPQYQEYVEKMTWDTYKQDLIYLSRFELYQMFSDNFSEINYYGLNEIQGKQFNAVAEGIIKESKNDINYYFQSFQTFEDKNIINVKTGDKIKIEIMYLGDDYKPVFDYIDADNIKPGSNQYTWWWNFSNNCNSELNDIADPLYQSGLFSNNYIKRVANEPQSLISVRMTKTDVDTKKEEIIFENTPFQFKMWSFTLKRRWT